MVKPFIAVDGEGGNDALGRHQYYLLRAGNMVLERKDKGPLEYEECFEFLSSLPKNRTYVGYFLNYDWTMVLRSLPENRVHYLLNRERRTPAIGKMPYPVDVGKYQIDWLPGKEFRVRKGKHNKWTIIHDTGSFFQAAFLKTIKTWGIGTQDNWADIEEGKSHRADFGNVTENIREYNQLECVLLAELMEEFRRVCEALNIVPRTWQGPGGLANALLDREGIATGEELFKIFPASVWELARQAFYGGWFETTFVGPVKGPIHQADVNSAYPYACTKIPCWRCGGWLRTHNRPTGLYLAKVKFRHKPGLNLCYFPVRRKDGSIHHPERGQGVYWSCEIEAAKRSGNCDVQIDDSWMYVERCSCMSPFRFVWPLYAARKSMGKSGRGIVLKLALNSIYGKMAQSIGSPKFANPVTASLITSILRGMLIDAISGCEDSIVMLATDGIFSTVKLNLKYGDELGEWDYKKHDDMFVIQPGLYVAGDELPKTRGVPRSKVIEYQQDFRDNWEGRRRDTVSTSVSGKYGGIYRKEYPVPWVEIPVTTFVGLKQAFAWGESSLAGQWLETTRDVSFEWKNKRQPGVLIETPEGCRTKPYVGDEKHKNWPYKKDIGASVRWRDPNDEDQPDWADNVIEIVR